MDHYGGLFVLNWIFFKISSRDVTNDTLFLADLAREGKVIGFDIQKEAIERTKKLLDKNSIKN